MTDKERQILCNILRTMEPWPCRQAADEIERLAKELAGSNYLLEINQHRRSLKKSGGFEVKQNKDMPVDYIPIGGAGNGA